MNALAKRVLRASVRTMRGLVDRLDPAPSTGNFSNPAFAYASINETMIRLMAENPRVLRPSYTWGILQGAHLARALDIDRVSVVEFGVAGGNGLVALEHAAARVEALLGVKIDVHGFDTGRGLPKPGEYRDLPNLYMESDYRMDVGALRNRLQRAELHLGMVADTVLEFVDSRPAPMAFVSFDLDYYTSTVDALKVFDAHPRLLLPRVHCYFDDIMGLTCSEFTGERLAIDEFNADHAQRKISPIFGLKYFLPPVYARQQWVEMFYLAHLFDHPLYGRSDGLVTNSQRPLQSHPRTDPSSTRALRPEQPPPGALQGVLRSATRALVPPYRAKRRPSRTVAIVVPLSSRPSLSPSEEQSLRHLCHFLGKYDKYLVAPAGSVVERAGFTTVCFPRKFFGSAAAHNHLVYWPRFYKAFEDYEYILMYQLDCLVFSDRLMHWCATDLDFIGAPWLPCPDTPWVKEARVGNGGFALMKIESVLQALHNQYRQEPLRYWTDLLIRNGDRLGPLFRTLERMQHRLPWLPLVERPLRHWRMSHDPSRHGRNNDYFWSFRAVKYLPTFKVATVEEGLRFAFEAAPRTCFELNHRQLPFGCHGWERFDPQFWAPFLLPAGAAPQETISCS